MPSDKGSTQTGSYLAEIISQTQQLLQAKLLSSKALGMKDILNNHFHFSSLGNSLALNLIMIIVSLETSTRDRRADAAE